MKNIKMISYRRAEKLGYIGQYRFCRCYFCESKDLIVDLNQKCYTQDICGYNDLVEYGVVCGKCHMAQGYVSYGQLDPVYVKSPKLSIFSRIRQFCLKNKKQAKMLDF